MSAESSLQSVRIYQRKRVSAEEVEVVNTSVDVSDSKDGKRRRFSVKTRSRRASVRQPSNLDDDESMLEDGEEADIPRCDSPTSIRTCSGFCAQTDKPVEGPTVVRSCVLGYDLPEADVRRRCQ